ncbi:MAG: hypothetical protein WCP20_11190 [Desulfuromonadales bacterium]
MKTEELNEYIFASMVNDIAQRRRRSQSREMEKNGIPEDEANAIPLTQEHIRHAVDLLGYVRLEAFAILKESEKASQQ